MFATRTARLRRLHGRAGRLTSLQPATGACLIQTPTWLQIIDVAIVLPGDNFLGDLLLYLLLVVRVRQRPGGPTPVPKPNLKIANGDPRSGALHLIHLSSLQIVHPADSGATTHLAGA